MSRCFSEKLTTPAIGLSTVPVLDLVPEDRGGVAAFAVAQPAAHRRVAALPVLVLPAHEQVEAPEWSLAHKKDCSPKTFEHTGAWRATLNIGTRMRLRRGGLLA